MTEELDPGVVITNVSAVDGDDGKFGMIFYIITGKKTASLISSECV